MHGRSRPQHVARWTLGFALLVAGAAHLTVGRDEFRAQVPPWIPFDADAVVVLSGIAEIALGFALLVTPWRIAAGWAAAVFFLAIFPGNIAQFAEARDGFGLDTDVARGVRLLFQPALVAWALWSTGAWSWWRNRRDARRAGGVSASMEP